MSVLAVVSKAVFEKEARVGGKLVAIGDVWPTAVYASQNPGLASLASGGVLVLATVRPGDQLWLVGVLHAPQKSSAGWSAPPNKAAVRDITSLMPQLRFTTGKGISAEPGKLGMSLQTPRQLTADDEALLLGSASAPVASAPKSSLVWRLENHRKRKLSTKLTAGEKTLLDPLMGLLEQNDEDEGGIELADVIDTASGNIVALYALWPVDAGTLIDAASGEEIGLVVESTFDARGDEALRARMRAAVEEAAPRIRFQDKISFAGGHDAPKRAPTPAATPDALAVLSEIRALHAELDATPRNESDPQPTMLRINALQSKVFSDELRPYPMRRVFELSEAQRAFLALAVDHYAWKLDLGHVGLPWKNAAVTEARPGATASPLARMIGRKPPLALDTLVTLDAEPHPLWALLSDVLIGARPDAAFLDALDAQPQEVRARAWRQLVSGEDGLGRLRPRDKKETQRGWADPKAQEAYGAKYHGLGREAFARLGDAGVGVAKAAFAEPVPKSVQERGAIDPLRVAALDGLARLAKTSGGVLDPAYDEAILDLVLAQRASSTALMALLKELPPERARELTALDYGLVQAFPSESGMRRLIEKIAEDPDYQFAKGQWAKMAAQLAAKFPEAALPLLQESKPLLKRYPDGLDKAIEAAQKALAKPKKPAKKE